jgi:outer membrane protein, heavy metal efflux system
MRSAAWLLSGLLLLTSAVARGQTPAATALSLDSAVAEAVRVSPTVRQGTEEAREAAALRRASFSLINPGLIVENPTGNFYTVGAQQTFEFPTVYGRQAHLSQAQAALAEQSRDIGHNVVRRDARQAYLALAVADARVRLLLQQDSLLRRLATAAERLRAAGQIDALQTMSLTAESRQATNRVVQAQADQRAASQRLALLLNRTNKSPLRVALDLTRPATTSLSDTLSLPDASGDTAALAQSPTLVVAAGAVGVAALNRRLTRARALPGLTVGFLNQGPREAPVATRWQGGLSLPLYFWQYRAQNRAAEARLRAAQAGQAATALAARRELTQAVAQVRKFAASLRYFTAFGLPQAAAIQSAAQRLFTAGEVDYLLLTQSLRQAAEIRADYLDAVRGYREALIEVDFLLGR